MLISIMLFVSHKSAHSAIHPFPYTILKNNFFNVRTWFIITIDFSEICSLHITLWNHVFQTFTDVIHRWQTHLRPHTFLHKLPRYQNCWHFPHSLHRQMAHSFQFQHWRKIVLKWPCRALSHPSGRTTHWRWIAQAVLHLLRWERKTSFSSQHLVAFCEKVVFGVSGKKLRHSFKP